MSIYKEFKTIDEQIKLLQSRGLKINNKKRLNFYLKSYNYQNIINAYNDPFMINFQRTKNQYLESANSDSIIELFNFDRSSSSLILSNIQNIERKFSTALVYIICEKMNSYSEKYGQICNIDRTIWNTIFKPDYKDENLLYSMTYNFRISNTNLCKKYRNGENGDWLDKVPLWSLSIFWSFGNAIDVFRNTNKGIKKQVIKFMAPNCFDNCDEFIKIMTALKTVRNRICHNNVLFNIDIKNNEQTISNFLKKKTGNDITTIRLADIIKIIDIILRNKEENKFFDFFVKNSLSKIKKSLVISKESKEFILEFMHFL